MDPSQLLQALQYSVGKTQQEVKMAEEFLLQAKTTSGYIPNLLLIACNKDVTIHVRQAAIVNLYSAVKLYWRRDDGTVINVPQEDKVTLKDNILEATIKCADTPKIYKQFIQIIIHISAFDFPDNWVNLLPAIIEKLNSSNDFQEVYGSLLALLAIFKKYDSLYTDFEKLEGLVEATFGFIEVFARKLLEDYGLQAAAAMHIILKIFFIAVNLKVPKYLLNEKNLDTWMTFLKFIIDKDLGQELESATEDQKVIREREKNVYWKNRKISTRITTSLLRKFRKVKTKTGNYKEFAQIFLKNYSIPFLKSLLEILFKTKERYLYVKVQFFAMRYILLFLKDANLRGFMKDHLEFYMFDILIPAMFLTFRDYEDWNENPIEFIRNEEDLTQQPNNLKTISQYTFKRMCKNDFVIEGNKAGDVILIKFMKHAGQILNNNVDPRTNQAADIRLKEAIMRIIGVLHTSILNNAQIKEQMEYLLEKFVVPEFANQNNFIRTRACWLFGIYGNLAFKGTQIVQTATEGLYKCLLDPQLPVKIQAALALDRVLEQKVALEILKPGLAKIFEIYLNLMSITDNEGIVGALEGIIKKFGEEISPYAVDLIKSLATVYAKHVNNEEEEEGEDDPLDDGFEIKEKAFAASRCLSAIGNILGCNVPQETIVACLDTLIELLKFTITDDRTDDIEGGLGLLNSILYTMKEIDERLWVFYLEINYMLAGKPEHVVHPNYANLPEDEKFLLRHKVTGAGSDYIGEMVPCLQNYIQKGRNVIFTQKDPYFGLTYIELLFKSIDRLYQMCSVGMYDMEMAVASYLYVTIIENYPKQIDNLIPYFLDKVIDNLDKSKTNMMRKIFIQMVALSLWYDPKSTLLYIENRGATENIFKVWIKLLPKFKLDFECERCMIGLASIFRVNVNDMPPAVLSSLPDLLKQLITLSSKIIVLRVEEEDEEGDGDDDEDADDEDFLGDSDEDDNEFDETMKKIEALHNKENGPSPFVDKDSFDPNDLAALGDDVLDKHDKFNDMQDFKTHEWLHSQADYDSPFDGQCEIAYLKESLEIMQQTQLDAYNQLIGCLSEEDKKKLQNNFEVAHKQMLEFNELKQSI